jgi:CubicO group peptidase (beta-lactamase class C family)
MNRLHALLTQRIHRAIEERVIPGCVVGTADRAGVRLLLSFGRFTYEADAPAVRENTVYDVASITKSIPLSCMALRLIDEGKLHPEHRLIDYVPELRNSDREKVLIRHLLTHTLHFGFALSSLKGASPAAIMDAILKRPFASRPGLFFSYANATSILLGLVVERLCGESLERAAQRVFFTPLGMKRTVFHPLNRFAKEEIVPTEIDPWRGGTVQGEVHDESAWALSRGTAGEGEKEHIIPCTPGSAGLFSAVPDLLVFLQMLLKGGRLGGRRYFSGGAVRRMHTNQIADMGLSTGLGWELNQPRYMGRYCSKSTFGKTGFTGCYCLCDPEKKLALVLLSNCTFPRRKPDKEAINALRRDVADLILQPADG